MNNNFIKLYEEIKKIKKLGWIPCSHKNYGSAGLKLEKLLGINIGNFELPDYYGIELKTKKSIKEENITLFCATPDKYLFEIKRLYNLYSYPENQNSEYKILSKRIMQGKLCYVSNNTYFTLKVDKNKKKLFLLIYDNKYNQIDESYWSFDILKEKLERKITYLCYTKVKTQYSLNQLYVKYVDDQYFKLKSFNCFIDLIEQGIINVTIRVGTFKSGKRIGQIHDHGTGFCISEKDLEKLFTKIYQ